MGGPFKRWCDVEIALSFVCGHPPICATNGAVTRRDLRPDDYLDIWPELAEASQAQAAASEPVAGQGVV